MIAPVIASFGTDVGPIMSEIQLYWKTLSVCVSSYKIYYFFLLG